MNADEAMHAALRQAAGWYAMLQSGEAGAAQRDCWRRWLAADPTHAAAWEKMEAVSRRFAALPAAPTLSALNTPGRARRSAAKKVLALGAVTAFGGIAARRDSRDALAALGAGEQTAVGEIRRLALADGAGLWMNTDTALDVDFLRGMQHVALHRGEILLHGAAASRPIVVDVLDGRLTASAPHVGVLKEGANAALTVYGGWRT